MSFFSYWPCMFCMFWLFYQDAEETEGVDTPCHSNFGYDALQRKDWGNSFGFAGQNDSGGLNRASKENNPLDTRGDCRGPFGLGKTNNAGKELTQWLRTHNMCWISSFFNHNRRGTWYNKNHKSWHEIDGFCCRNKDRSRLVKKISTRNDITLTDHRPKQMTIRTRKIQQKPPEAPKKIAWEHLNCPISKRRFAKALEGKTNEMRNWSSFSNILREAGEKVCGLARKEKLNPWMHGKEETIKECQERITTWTKNIEKAESPEDKETAREKRRQYRREFRNLKKSWEKDWWERKTEESREAAERGELGRVYKILRELGVRDGNTKALTEEFHTPEEYKIHFEKVSTERNERTQEEHKETKEKINALIPERPQSETLEKEIEISEMIGELNKMTNSAAGEDGIQLIALKNLSDDATKQLFNLLEDMAENSPDTWDELARSGLVVPIFKKGDRKSLDNYRGVCLLSAISRILARIMATRIRKWTEEENIIDDTQCGFRKGRSTADATQIVIRVNEEVLRRRGLTEVGECSQSHPTATLLDITKAYPRVNRPLLWYILERLGFGERSLRIIRGLHETTFYRVKGKKEVSSPWTPMRGLREGCATSPVLFNIYHNISMRMATRERDPNSGIRWKWIKGNSFPPINIRRANTSTNTEECRLQSILFADDTTVFGTRDQMEKEKRIVKANMRRLEEKCHDGKEETLLFGERKSQDIRILGSYVGRVTDLAKRKERGNKALWTTKRRLKGSTLPKKLQARSVEACVESTILFDCQTRPWRDREIKQLQRIADQGYT